MAPAMTKTKSWTVRGLRVNKIKNRDSRWGPGHVHWVIWIPGDHLYVRICRRFASSERALGGVLDWGNVPRDEDVTCQLCLNAWEAIHEE